MDDIRLVYSEELSCELVFEDMVSFLSSCPELARREHTRQAFRLFCLCLGHDVPDLPKVELCSSQVGSTNVDLCCIIEPIQGHLLSSVAERNFPTDMESSFVCLEQLLGFWDTALQPGYNV